MKLLNNRSVAWTILAICVIVSVLGLGGNSLAAQRREAVRVFNDGIEETAVVFSMDAYLENCSKYAITMLEEYRLHVSSEDELPTKMQELAGMIGDGDLDARHTAYVSLTENVESLFTKFHAANVSDKDAEVFDHAYQNYQGEVSKIKYDEYHVLAERFNRNRQGFPANAIAGLFGLDPLNAF